MNKKNEHNIDTFQDPSFHTVLKLVWSSIKTFFKERPGQIIGSAFILIMLWGYHGNLELLKFIIPEWSPPGENVVSRTPLLEFVLWDREIISFFAGVFLVVVIPILIIKFGFKQSLSDYGLGLPPKGRRKLAAAVFFTLTIVCLIPFYIGASDKSMQEVYPFYKNFTSISQFIIYEITYIPFFIAIEFIFRGYILFGLAGVKDFEVEKAGGGLPGQFYFYRYAILIQMLSYTAWHLGKPLPELWGTPVWGLAAGVCTYSVRSIWPATFSHWILNVFLDAIILSQMKIIF
jgi:hypothetical protein